MTKVFNFPNLKVSNYCSPNASSCYAAVSKDIHGCKISCTGLYADVMYTDDVPEEVTEQEKMRQILAMVNKYVVSGKLSEFILRMKLLQELIMRRE